jgi:hypothetical protein
MNLGVLAFLASATLYRNHVQQAREVITVTPDTLSMEIKHYGPWSRISYWKDTDESCYQVVFWTSKPLEIRHSKKGFRTKASYKLQN